MIYCVVITNRECVCNLYKDHPPTKIIIVLHVRVSLYFQCFLLLLQVDVPGERIPFPSASGIGHWSSDIAWYRSTSPRPSLHVPWLYLTPRTASATDQLCRLSRYVTMYNAIDLEKEFCHTINRPTIFKSCLLFGTHVVSWWLKYVWTRNKSPDVQTCSYCRDANQYN